MNPRSDYMQMKLNIWAQNASRNNSYSSNTCFGSLWARIRYSLVLIEAFMGKVVRRKIERGGIHSEKTGHEIVRRETVN